MQKEYFIYYGTIFIAAILGWAAQKMSKDKRNIKLNKVFWYLSMIVLIFTIGCRKTGVGVDDLQYERIFNSVLAQGPIAEFFQTTMEPGYLILNYLVGIFTTDFQVFLFIISALSVFLFYKALEYEKDRVNMFLAIFLFGTMLYLYFFGIIRLFFAAAIIAYSLRYVFEKKTKKFILFVFLASMVHYSAFFMIFLVYFSTEKEEKPRSMRNIILLVMIGVPVLIFVVTNIIFPMMGSRYQWYLNMGHFSITIDQFDKLPFIIMALFFYKDILKINKNIKIYTVIYALTIVISIYSTIVDIGRIQWYLNFAICIILPSIVRAMNKNSKWRSWNVILVPLIILYGLLYSYSIVFIQSTNKCMTDYQNIFFQL